MNKPAGLKWDSKNLLFYNHFFAIDRTEKDGEQDMQELNGVDLMQKERSFSFNATLYNATCMYVLITQVTRALEYDDLGNLRMI